MRSQCAVWASAQRGDAQVRWNRGRWIGAPFEVESLRLGARVGDEDDGQRAGGGVARRIRDVAIQGVQHRRPRVGSVIQDEVIEEQSGARCGGFDVDGPQKLEVQRASGIHREGEVLVVAVGVVFTTGIRELPEAIRHRGVGHRVGDLGREGAGAEPPDRGKQEGACGRFHRVSVMRMTGLTTAFDTCPARSVIRKVSRVDSSPPLPSRNRGGS